MPIVTLDDVDQNLAEEIVNRWLTGAPVEGWTNPAGDLFTSGEYAVQEITMTLAGPGTYCSGCSGSQDVHCC